MNLHHFTLAELAQWVRDAQTLRRILEHTGEPTDIESLDANIRTAKRELRRRVEAAPLVRLGPGGDYTREIGGAA